MFIVFKALVFSMQTVVLKQCREQKQWGRLVLKGSSSVLLLFAGRGSEPIKIT